MIQSNLNFEFKQFENTDTAILEECAELVTSLSWGIDYPVNPISEMINGDLHIAVYKDGDIIAYAGINRVASPDTIGNNNYWLSDAVVRERYRNNGIYKKLYKIRIEWLKARRAKKVFTCTSNKILENHLYSLGWILERMTTDEGGYSCNVLRLSL